MAARPPRPFSLGNAPAHTCPGREPRSWLAEPPPRGGWAPFWLPAASWEGTDMFSLYPPPRRRRRRGSSGSPLHCGKAAVSRAGEALRCGDEGPGLAWLTCLRRGGRPWASSSRAVSSQGSAGCRRGARGAGPHPSRRGGPSHRAVANLAAPAGPAALAGLRFPVSLVVFYVK